MALNKNDILGLDDIKIKELVVPEWDGTIHIKQLTRGQADGYYNRRFGKSQMSQSGRKSEVETPITLFGHDAWIVAQGVCDESGKRIFSNSEAKALDEKNGNAIGFIAVQIIKFSGMSQDVEELEDLKN